MKISDPPSRAKLLAGLTPREVHPPLVRAEDDAAKAERDLVARRAELANHERRVAELPAKIQRGEVKASALADALRERDACALLVGQAERTRQAANDRVAAEERAAKDAVDREFFRRAEQLERIVAEVRPLLDGLLELADALAAARGGGFLALDWPDSPATTLQRVQAERSSAPAPTWLPYSGHKVKS